MFDVRQGEVAACGYEKGRLRGWNRPSVCLSRRSAAGMAFAVCLLDDHLELRSSLLTFGRSQASLVRHSLNRNLLAVAYIDAFRCGLCAEAAAAQVVPLICGCVFLRELVDACCCGDVQVEPCDVAFIEYD